MSQNHFKFGGGARDRARIQPLSHDSFISGRLEFKSLEVNLNILFS